MLAQRALTADGMALVRLIQDSGDQFLRLLNDLLDIARTDEGTMSLVDVDILPVLKSVFRP